MLAKVLGCQSEGLDVEARGPLGMFARLKPGTDAQMGELKQADGFWDDRLGVSLDCDNPRFSGAASPNAWAIPRRVRCGCFVWPRPND